MRDEAFKVQMFRFVDVLASLRRSDDIVEHLREYFHGMDGFVPMMQTGLKAAGIFPWLTAYILRRNVSGMARQFIAGQRRRRRDEDTAQEAQTEYRVHGRFAGRSGRERKGSERIRGARDGIARNALARDPRLDRSVRQKRRAFSGGQSFAQDLRLLFADGPGRARGSDRASRAQAPPDPAPGERGRRLRQFRHGELRAEKQHARPVQAALYRGRSSSTGRTSGSSSRLICAMPSATCAT